MKTIKMQWNFAVKHQDLLRDTVAKYIDQFFPRDSSGASAVAIDNKIEQAMDLVKSHLMFAVREEVEVLKEKIVELTGRINQLEYENTVLKANASQEILQQLTVPPQPQQQVNVPPAAPTSMGSGGGGGGKPQQAPATVS